ncbi:MAG: hypothetical protein EA424_08365 [Planctomycetaceae bacterium]|nr:MAG: hypothetical protein EA424_08365 [Planctomycetaceae bacterium]
MLRIIGRLPGGLPVLARLFAGALCLLWTGRAGAAIDQELADQARQGLHRAVTYLTEEVAHQGGYVGSYLADLSQGFGKLGSRRGPTWNWIQSPGTPAMGFAFLHVWEATGEPPFLEAAVGVAHALVRGQLESGGWDDNVDHSPQGERTYFYRRNAGSSDPRLTSGRNRSTFDDNISQHATRLLIAVDQALAQQDASIREAVDAALELFITAQDERGGWPQNYPLAGRGYGDFYTYNDGAIRDCIDVLMLAYRTYGDPRYHDAVVRGGEFILRTQLPEPHPIWAQQYDPELQPAWARRMEPPAACAGESAGIVRLLPEIAIFTNDTRFLDPLPAALDWYQRSQIAEGRWARYYELKTNRPLYQISRNRTAYWLSYEDHDTPDHYAFQGSWGRGLDTVRQAYEAMRATSPADYARQRQPRERTRDEQLERARRMESRVREVLDQQDKQGRWVERRDGQDMLMMATFQRNLRTLADYLAPLP